MKFLRLIDTMYVNNKLNFWKLTFLLSISVCKGKANEQYQLDDFIVCKQECECTVEKYNRENDQYTSLYFFIEYYKFLIFDLKLRIKTTMIDSSKI